MNAAPQPRMRNGIAAGDPGFVVRQPILDCNENVAGYELLIDEHAGSAEAAPAERDRQLVDTLAALDLARLAEHRIACLTVGLSQLASPALAALPRHHVLVAVRLDGADPALALPALKDFVRHGPRLVLEEVDAGASFAPLLAVADFVRLDAARRNALELLATASKLMNSSKVRLIAGNIKSQDDYEACRTLPFAYFQGPYFANRRRARELKLEHEHGTVIEALNLVRDNADIKRLDAVFRRDPGLTYHLLRYINSPGCGICREVTSIANAVTLLGYQQLYRWLTLLLFTRNGGRGERALLVNALVRGRLVELLGERSVPPPYRDSLFIVGVFSLLDALLGTSLERALEDIALPQVVRDALIARQGPLAPFLTMALACEATDAHFTAKLCAEHRLDAARVNAAHIEALHWAETVAGD